jgi:electron transfer flavoprotein alpha subunit
MQPFGGRIVTTSAFTGDRGIILLRSNRVVAEPLAAPGRVETGAAVEGLDVAPVRVVERVVAQSTGPSIDEARVIVSGGRGVGGPEGFAGLGELAGLLGGAVGATRAAVDAGWVDYAIQIGQTGKTVKPAVYLAFGVSGAIQHKVGMQTAETIVAVNRDPDAPIGEFADLFVVADLAAVVPALAAALRARAG